MTTLTNVRGDDFAEAADLFEELVRVPVEDGHVLLGMDGAEKPTFEFRGQHIPEPGEVFSVLCSNCSEVHALMLRSADAWHIVFAGPGEPGALA